MMNLAHPLDFVPPDRRRRLLFILMVATIGCFIIFQILDIPLRTPAAPNGIVGFELAGSVEKAGSMLNSWDEGAKLNNAFGLGFDFLFMPIYATALSLGVLLAMNRRKGSWKTIGEVLGWGAFAAVLFDATENVALFSILQGNLNEPYPQIAAICASIKFGLIVAGVIFGLAGLVFPERNQF